MIPRILEVPYVKDIYNMNDPANFTAHFQSRKANTTVTWLHNGGPPENNAMIVTRYPSTDGESPATTSLLFSALAEANTGNYTLIISSNYTRIPSVNRTATTAFIVFLISTYNLYFNLGQNNE